MIPVRGICLSLWLASTVAVADPKPNNARAEKLYDEGLTHYNVAEYAQAIASWKQSYVLSKEPLLLFNIAQAYRLSGDCTQALRFYNSYAREVTAPANQHELDDAIESCRTKAAQPPTQPPPPPPPAATPPSEPAPAPAVEGHSSHRMLGLIVGGVGVVLTGAAGYFTYDGRVQRDVLTKDTAWTQQDIDARSRGQRDNELAWTFGIGGGVAIVAGAVLYVLGGEDTHGVAFVPRAGGGSVAWQATF